MPPLYTSLDKILAGRNPHISAKVFTLTHTTHLPTIPPKQYASLSESQANATNPTANPSTPPPASPVAALPAFPCAPEPPLGLTLVNTVEPPHWPPRLAGLAARSDPVRGFMATPRAGGGLPRERLGRLLGFNTGVVLKIWRCIFKKRGQWGPPLLRPIRPLKAGGSLWMGGKGGSRQALFSLWVHYFC
jgi:hypothetical protein